MSPTDAPTPTLTIPVTKGATEYRRACLGCGVRTNFWGPLAEVDEVFRKGHRKGCMGRVILQKQKAFSMRCDLCSVKYDAPARNGLLTRMLNHSASQHDRPLYQTKGGLSDQNPAAITLAAAS